ncbi:MAG: carboxymethylenebutenolidase, partial [Bradyrhizobium sp.]
MERRVSGTPTMFGTCRNRAASCARWRVRPRSRRAIAMAAVAVLAALGLTLANSASAQGITK